MRLEVLGVKNLIFPAYQIEGDDEYNRKQVKFHQTGGLEVGSKGQISLNFNYNVNWKDFYTKCCVVHIERNFPSVAWVMRQGWDLGVMGGGGGGGGQNFQCGDL